MDPEANYAEQRRLYGSADSHDKARLRELVAALRGWVAAGGFKPKGYVGPAWSPRKEAAAGKAPKHKYQCAWCGKKLDEKGSHYMRNKLCNAPDGYITLKK
jgi:hypothetical protein